MEQPTVCVLKLDALIASLMSPGWQNALVKKVMTALASLLALVDWSAALVPSSL